MLEVRSVVPLQGRVLRLTLTDGSVVDRDVSDLLFSPIFDRVIADDGFFRRVRARHGTVAWPGNLDLAPETLIWDGPGPRGDSPSPRPEPFLRPQPPRVEAAGDPGHRADDRREIDCPQDGPMPEVSRFFGIVIQMHWDDHLPPHFHARYAGRKARIAIADSSVLGGMLPARALGLVAEWAALHRSELMADWELARVSQPLVPIEPLR
jgi:hypothetical protein